MSKITILPTHKALLSKRRALRRSVTEMKARLRGEELYSTTAGLDIVLPDRLEIRRQYLVGAWRTPDQPKYAEPGHFDPCFYEFKSELKAKIAQLAAVEDSLKAWGK